MAIQQGGVDIQTAGGAPVNNFAFNDVPGIQTGDLMLVYVCVRAVVGTDPFPHVISAPFRWEKITEFSSILFGIGGVRVSAYSFHKTSLGAPYSFVWDSPREAVGFLLRYYDDTGLQVRATGRLSANGTLQAYQDCPSINATLANQRLVCFYAAGAVIDTWTPDVLQAEIADVNSFTGSGSDVSAMVSDEALGGTGLTGIRTATLDGGVGNGMSIGISTLLTAGGVSLDANMSMFTLYDNALSITALGFDPPELNIGYPNSVIANTGGNYPRWNFAAGVTLGSAAGSAPTTFIAKDCEINSGASIWTTHGSNLGSWTWEFGEKSGSGEDEVGSKGVVFINLTNKTFRGNQKFYACTFVNQVAGSQTLAFQPQLGGLVSEMLDCTFVFESNGAGGFTLSFGQSGTPFGTRKRTKVFAKSTGGTFTFREDFCTVNEDTEVEAIGFSRVFDSPLASAYAMRKVKVRGNPSSSTFRWGTASNLHRVSGMRFPPGAKFSVGTSGVPTLANAFRLDALYEKGRIVDANTGLPLVGIPFKITDFLGVEAVNVVSDANGFLTWSSGQTLDAVLVAEFYAVTTVATMRYRGPFLFEVNVGGNPAYEARRRRCDWPSDVAVTNTVGNFLDVVGETWALGPASSLASSIPIPSDGTIRVFGAAPEYV